MRFIALLVAMLALITPARVASQDGDPPGSVSPELSERLGALSPTRPSSYLELGEELAASGSAPDAELARRLFVLAIATGLDAGDRSIAGGACMALARMAQDTQEQRWLLTMASVIDPRVRPETLEPREPTRTDIEASIALTRVRSGDGRIARRALEGEAIRASIEAYASAAWYESVLDESRRWPCPGCHNDRVQDDPDHPGSLRLCATCAGNPGPAYTRAELLEHLRVEGALLGVRADSWAAQLALGHGAPLKEADPRSIAPYFGVDPDRACWRRGGWVACAPGEPAP